MTISYTEYPEKSRIEITVAGRVTKADYDEVIPQLEPFIDTHGTIQMVEVVETFEGFEAAVLLPGIKFDFQNIKHISHVALVTDIGWMGPLSRAASMVLPTKMRIFALEDRDQAHAWLDAETAAP